MNLMAEGAWAINSVSAIARPLQFLAFHSEKAYRDMIINKVSAADKETFNLHNLISAFCELSVMNTFICRSSDPKSFVYEIELGMILIRMLSFYQDARFYVQCGGEICKLGAGRPRNCKIA